ncbi:MAG: N-methyl-D-aspartate receptor NMDAR2C subunit, partial [Nanoarchaeota archaeon]|nr:N-methyl-D-aspartate receptor NMDAR2C subunit [Nanoarchaeota archaeon]
MNQKLRTNWNDLCSRLHVSQEEAQQTLQDLQQRYGEPHRQYHNLDHIAHCLNEFDAARRLAEQPDLVQLALWFHDCVYEPGNPENELNSAEVALAFGENIGLGALDRLRVYELIITTQYVIRPGTDDARLIWDVDFSSLGLLWEEFSQNSQNIREEFKHVPDELFYAGR